LDLVTRNYAPSAHHKSRN